MPNPFYQKFHAKDLGVNTENFLRHLRPVYETLEWDPYDALRGGLTLPTRKRAVAETLVEKRGGIWTVLQTSAQPYVQPTNYGAYDRNTPRPYPEPPAQGVMHPEMVRLQQGLAEWISFVRGGVESLRLILTFLRTVDDEDRKGICALEGEPHKDGMEYIVSALVIHRENLKEDTGMSSVHLPDGQQLYESVLQPGEGIFQDDQNLLHHITNIQRRNPSKPGFRDMLGVDFIINPY